MLVTALERKHNQIRQEGRQESELIGEIRATQKFLKHPVMPTDEVARKSQHELATTGNGIGAIRLKRLHTQKHAGRFQPPCRGHAEIVQKNITAQWVRCRDWPKR